MIQMIILKTFQNVVNALQIATYQLVSCEHSLTIHHTTDNARIQEDFRMYIFTVYMYGFFPNCAISFCLICQVTTLPVNLVSIEQPKIIHNSVIVLEFSAILLCE